MTSAKIQIIEDAKKAGYTITTHGTITRIAKTVGRWKRLEGLDLFDDGFAMEINVDLAAAKAVRSHKTMRSMLGI